MSLSSLSTQKSPNLKIGVGQIALAVPPNSQMSQKRSYACFKSLRTAYVHYKIVCFHQPCLSIIPTNAVCCVPLLMLDLKIGKGRQVTLHLLSRHTRSYRHYTALQGTRLSIPHWCYNSNVAMARRVCVLESSILLEVMHRIMLQCTCSCIQRWQVWEMTHLYHSLYNTGFQFPVGHSPNSHFSPTPRLTCCQLNLAFAQKMVTCMLWTTARHNLASLVW